MLTMANAARLVPIQRHASAKMQSPSSTRIRLQGSQGSYRKAPKTPAPQAVPLFCEKLKNLLDFFAEGRRGQTSSPPTPSHDCSKKLLGETIINCPRV